MIRVTIDKNGAAEQERERGSAESSSLPRGATRARLRVSEPGDASELEAERFAERVVSARPPGSPTGADTRPDVIPRAAEDSTAPAVEREPFIPRGGGEPLPAHARDFFEPRFGRDLGDVRVHTGADAADAAKALAARGYAVGRHLVFGAGQFAPGTPAGDRLLAHELTHAVFGAHEPVVHRSPDQSLDVVVPDPADAHESDIKYLWQNPELRKTIYPFRDEMLSYFLRTYMEIDLDDPAAAAKMKTVGAEELREERLTLSEQVSDIQRDIDFLERKLKEAEKAKVPSEEAAADRSRLVELYYRQRRVKGDLEYLPKPDNKDNLPPGARKKWAAYQYSKYGDEGNELTHDELLARILDRFDADKTFTRYPKWLRYMVIHFSGMRYKSAHGSYAPAAELVRRLKREQVTSEMEAAPKTVVAKLGEMAVQDVESELDPADKPKPARAAALRKRLAELKAVEAERATEFSKKGQETQRAAFAELMKLEDERDALMLQLDDSLLDTSARKRLAELEPLIKAAEARIDSKALQQVRKRVKAAEDRRRAAVTEHELEKASEALASLDDAQAVAVLRAMRADKTFPEWVWRELVRVTDLKLDVKEGEDWEKVTAEEEAEKKKKDPVTARWRQIMKDWEKDVTGWREKHGKDLSLVVIRAVCNEIAEMSLHARGVKPAGGISQKAQWYASKASGGSFSRPKGSSDLQPGASLFFLEWSDKKAHDAVSVVRSDTAELQNEKGEPISDGLQADGWTYKFNADKTVTRTRVVVPRPVVVTSGEAYTTQHLNWTHEAQIVEVDEKRKRVITFETGPIGLRAWRPISSVVGAWNVYVGFAQSGAEPADIDKYLKDLLPGRRP